MLMCDLKGQLLLATPNLQDPQFKDSVVLLCHHDESGSMGLIINRPQDISIADVLTDIQLTLDEPSLEHLPELQQHSYEGGPQDPFRGFVLHNRYFVYESTMQISPELHLTTSKDVLEQWVQQKGPDECMLILGYAGWSSGQLEQEILDNHWLITAASSDIIFHTPPELRWALAAQSQGVDKARLSSQMGHA